MKFIKQFSSKTEMDDAMSQIKHKDGIFLYCVSNDKCIEHLTIYDHKHPGTNCVKLNPVNMEPVKLDTSSTKKKPVVGDVLYSTIDDKLTLDAQTNSTDNTPIAICVIPEVIENFSEGDDSTGAVKTARFVSINFMSCKTPTIGSVNWKDQQMYFGNYGVNIGNTKGSTNYRTEYVKNIMFVGGKWNTQQCLFKATKQDQYICDGITNSKEIGYCAPACCCIAYSTPGTKPGDWYLPTPIELYQIYKNKTVIYKKRTELVGADFTDDQCWSSKEYSNTHEYYIDHSHEVFNKGTKEAYRNVLAFLAVEI